MQRRLKYDALAGSGLVIALGVGPVLSWWSAALVLGVSAGSLLALTHWRVDANALSPVPRSAWIAPMVTGLALVALLLVARDAGRTWLQQAMHISLMVVTGVSLGVAAMTRPRARHVWALAPLIGALAHAGPLFVLWALLF